MSVGLKCHHGSPARIGQLSSDKCSIGWKLFCKTCYDHFPGEHTGLVWNTQMGVSSWNGCCLGYKPCRPCHFFLTVSFLSHGQWLIYPCWFSFPMLWWNVQQTAWYSVAQKLTTGWMIQFERGSELALHGVMRDRRLEDLDKFPPPSSFMGCSSVWSLHVHLTEKSCLPSNTASEQAVAVRSVCWRSHYQSGD